MTCRELIIGVWDRSIQARGKIRIHNNTRTWGEVALLLYSHGLVLRSVPPGRMPGHCLTPLVVVQHVHERTWGVGGKWYIGGAQQPRGRGTCHFATADTPGRRHLHALIQETFAYWQLCKVRTWRNFQRESRLPVYLFVSF